jgi:hypothetical protein
MLLRIMPLGVIAVACAVVLGSIGARADGGSLTPPAQRELRLPGVSAISARGDLVAIAAERPLKCGTIRLWSRRTRRLQSVPAGCSSAGGYNDISELALGPTLLGWVFSWGDRDSGSDCLQIRRVSAERIGGRITREKRDCDVDYFGEKRTPAFESVPNGGTTGALGELLTSVHAGSFGLVYSIESYCNYEPSCPTGALVPRHVDRTRRVSTAADETEIAGRGVRIVAAGRNTIAALRAGSLSVYDVGTRAWRTIAPGPVRAARMSGDKLFVLRANAMLETYSLRSRRRLHSQRLSGKAQLEDGDGAFVVYVSGGQIHVRRTGDGKEIVLAVPSVKGSELHAQIEAPGLYYSYNVHGSGAAGRVGFVPRSRLKRALG